MINVIQNEDLCKFIKIFDDRVYVEKSGAVYIWHRSHKRWTRMKTFKHDNAYRFVDYRNSTIRKLYTRRILNYAFNGFPESEMYKRKYDS